MYEETFINIGRDVPRNEKSFWILNNNIMSRIDTSLVLRVKDKYGKRKPQWPT